jgi:preprotein translocase subunit SecB
MEGFTVRRIDLDVPSEWAATSPQKLDVDIRESFGISDDRRHARVGLTCAVVSTPQSQERGLRLVVEIEGIFTVLVDEGERELVDRVLHENTLAILFPFLRSAVSVVTVAANIPPLVLPVVNIVEMLKTRSGNKSS